MLAEIKVNKKKLMLHVMIRMIIVAGLEFGWYCASKTTEVSNPNYIPLVIITVLLLIYALSPLRYINRALVYYHNKIVFGKKELTFEHPSEIQWMNKKTYLTGTRLVIYKKNQKQDLKDLLFTSSSEMDITYMDNPKDAFVKCYFNKGY